MSRSKKQHIVSISKFTFACKDLAEAGKVIAYFSKLTPVIFKKVGDDYAYFKDGDMQSAVRIDTCEPVIDEIPAPKKP